MSVRLLVVAIAASLAAPAMAGPVEPDVVSRTRVFLDAYARGDAKTVLAMVDSGEISIYGSDVSEFFETPATVSKMMADDQQLWRGSAHIGEMRHISVRQSPTLAVLVFDAPFSVGGSPEVSVRFSMTWRRQGGVWLLTQSSNAVPTVGSSAAELLARPR